MTWDYEVKFVQQKRSLFHQEDQLISRIVYSRDKKVKLLNPEVKDKRRICFLTEVQVELLEYLTKRAQYFWRYVHADLSTLATIVRNGYLLRYR